MMEQENLSGASKRIKMLVQKENPIALHTWCHAHRFSLVIQKIVESWLVVKKLFKVVDEFHTFMNGHRWRGLLCKH